MTHSELILILDYGSQYTQLIARRVRELGVYSELHPFNIAVEKIKSLKPKGIILSGSPFSTYEKEAPISSPEIFELGIPVLGICYGLQLMAYQLGGEVDKAARREYGHAELMIDDESDLFDGFGVNGTSSTTVWMSHGDHLTKMPQGFQPVAHTSNSPICALKNVEKKIYGIQFHPEVVHTPKGKEVLRNFLYKICECKGGWSPTSFIQNSIEDITARVGKGKVICALSGGVDSSVAAVLLHKAIGDQLYCIHINNGLMRKGESDQVVQTFRDNFKMNLDYVDTTDLFLTGLEGVTDPEK
ncbi:MAG: glutamine-hydrolyzing GMP synthase, partial [Bacteroidota bacterium]